MDQRIAFIADWLRGEWTLTDLATPRREEIFLAFQLDLIREAGYLPSLGGCTNCGAPFTDRGEWFFSPARSALVCRNCQGIAHDRVEIAGRLVSLAQMVLRRVDLRA